MSSLHLPNTVRLTILLAMGEMGYTEIDIMDFGYIDDAREKLPHFAKGI